MAQDIERQTSALPSAQRMNGSDLSEALSALWIFNSMRPDTATSIPERRCQMVLSVREAIDNGDRCVNAAKYGLALMGCYRAKDFVDVEIFASALSATLSQYPECIVALAVCPVRGLPAKAKFAPSIAEVRTHLDGLCEGVKDAAWAAEKVLSIRAAA